MNHFHISCRCFVSILIASGLLLLCACSQEESTSEQALSESNPEESAWEQAVSENTFEAYKNFLDQYPESEHAEDANLKIEELYFEQAKEAGTASGYREFLERYPDGRLVQQATSLLESAVFETVKEENTLIAYENFLLEYPDNAFADHIPIKIIHLSEDEPFKTDSTPSDVGTGTISFSLGDEPGTEVIDIDADVPVVDQKACVGCVDTIRIAPNQRAALDPWFMASDMLVRSMGYVSSRIVLKDMSLVGPYPTDKTEYLVSGPEGAVLKKVTDGFILVEGSAYLLITEITPVPGPTVER